jgi:hypothetical protein
MIRLLLALVVLSAILGVLYFQQKKRDLDKKAYDILKKRYLESLAKDNVPLMLAAGKDFSDFHALQPTDLDQLYKDALRLVREDPNQKLYALEIGRRKYAAKRQDHRPTIHDEAAIQNDIEAAMM